MGLVIRMCCRNAALVVLMSGLMVAGPVKGACGDETRFSLDGVVTACDAFACGIVGLSVGDPLTGFLVVNAAAAGPNSTFTETDIIAAEIAAGGLSTLTIGSFGSTTLTTDANGEIVSGTVSGDTEVDTGIGIAVIEIIIDAEAETWETTTAFLGLGVIAAGTISFVRNPDTDGDGQPDTCDPDDDNDGVGDLYDRDRLIADNNCTTNDGTDATLVSAQIMIDHTCAATASVDVNGDNGVLDTVVFGPDGDLLLISEKVIFNNTRVEAGGRMEVLNADPCPGCTPP